MAKSSKEYELAIKIAGEIEKSFYNSTKLTKKELQEIAKQASASSNSVSASFNKGFDDLDKGFDHVSKAAEKAFDFIKKAAEVATATILAITIASTAAGLDFESAFAGVKKTTDATAMEYAAIREEILELSNTELPATASEIAEVAEAAGQLGISKEYLLDFSRVMIDLGESTNLTATEGASQLAKFANITSMSADNYSRLGSTIVGLGNNFATTEADIVSMALRLAASGELTGLTEAQILALATSMSSVGIEAEAGGSAMSKLLKKMAVATETGKGELKEFAAVAGMSTKDFQKAFKSDAVGALSAFIDGLNDTKRNGKSAITILDDMGLTEIRLSNMILSLANANGVMSEAIGLSNKAWEENTALSKEAEQRYATNESKLKIFKNSITGLGIKLYDEYSEPLGNAITKGTEFANSISKNIMPNAITAFKDNLPTVIRNVKEFGSSFTEFADPFLSFGKWLIQNPGIVVSTLVGIGSALMTYKVASGIRSMAKAFSGLNLILTNPFALAITAVALAIGGAAGIITYIKNAEKEMKKQNLAEHFGNIALSLDDLKDVATHIIKTKSLSKLNDALSAMSDMENISDSIKRSVKELNRMNWKVGIGMELTDSEKDMYMSEITSYIAEVQNLVTQKQYAVTLAVEVLMGEGRLETSNVIDKINAFYANKQKELTELGTKLNETVTEAFQDGLLDIDEVKEITELQNQMAKIQSAIAGSQFDAQLEILNLKYSGADLDPETFKNLQAETGEQIQKAVAKYDESLMLGIANAKIMLEDGAINQAEYDSVIRQLKEGYLNQISELELKALNFQVNTIMDQYSDELEAAMPGFQKTVTDALQGSTDYINSGLDNMVLNFDVLLSNVEGYEGLNKATKLAIKDLFDQLNPTVEQVNLLKHKYREFGVGIPESVINGLNEASIIGALVDDYNSIWTVLGNATANSEEYTKSIESVKEKGWYVPEELANAINDNKSAVDDSIADLYSYTQKSIHKFFSSGININVPILFNPKTGNPQIPDGWAAYANPSALGGHADGGIFDTPHVAWFAEKGPEAAIPLDGTPEAIDLWKTTGKMLGVYTQGKSGESFASFSNNNDDSFGSLLEKVGPSKKKANDGGEQDKITITYSPNYNFYGGAPAKDEIVEAARISQEEFDQKMDQWIRAKGRKQFV